MSKEVNNILVRIANAKNKQDAIDNVFYSNSGSIGIDRLYQLGKITANEHELLFKIIEKLAD